MSSCQHSTPCVLEGESIQARTIVIDSPDQLLPPHHLIITPSLFSLRYLSFLYQHPPSSDLIHCRPSKTPQPHTFHDLDQFHPTPFIEPSTIKYINCTSNNSHSSNTMGTAPRQQLASRAARRKQPKQREQLKRTYKIPRSLKKAIKKNLIKIVKQRERKVRDEEVSTFISRGNPSLFFVLIQRLLLQTSC